MYDAAANEHQHVRRGRAEERADHVDGEPDQHGGAPPVDIGELAVERGERGGRDQKSRDQPWQIVHPAEVAPDRRQRARQHRLID